MPAIDVGILFRTANSDTSLTRIERREMLNFLFRSLLTFNATSLLVIVYLIKSNTVLPPLALGDARLELPWYVSFGLYCLVPIALTGTSLLLAKLLGRDEFKRGDVVSIEHANNSFLPSYLGYFFVALSIPNLETLYFVYGMLFVFTLLSQALYFNPIFLLFGYEFYNIRTKAGTCIFLISRARYKTPASVQVEWAARINDYTYIQKSCRDESRTGKGKET